MKFTVMPQRSLFSRSPLVYGHFLEHFHRQIYGGIYMPGHPLADKQGFRSDVIDALKRIQTPVIRWPGGCFVSSYHWEKGVGPHRTPSFDKAWRVEDDNSFGTDEFIAFCREVGCAPYICTNAGTGTEEEMSNWMEYCNLSCEGEYARRRIENGHREPYGVKYWSIGNENYGSWEIGAKEPEAWGCLVREAAKMMKHVDPTAELSAAALSDIHWNSRLLDQASPYLSWISIHSYWDFMPEVHNPANYEACMAYTADLEAPVRRVRGLLMAYGLEKKIKIAYDEWNLRSWHHPNVHTKQQGVNPSDYILPRDKNDINQTYTIADAVFSACFLNMVLRNADLIGMANFAPIVNTRGAILTHNAGLVLRPTYYVFDLYTNLMGDEILDSYIEANPVMQIHDKEGHKKLIEVLDFVATRDSASGSIRISAVNKHEYEDQTISIHLPVQSRSIEVVTLCGNSPDDYNDIDRSSVLPFSNSFAIVEKSEESFSIQLPPHSVNIIRIE